MARLWEDTLVIALRDRQWLQCLAQKRSERHPTRVYPQTLVKLDGNAERDAGDLLFEADASPLKVEAATSPFTPSCCPAVVASCRWRPEHLNWQRSFRRNLVKTMFLCP